MALASTETLHSIGGRPFEAQPSRRDEIEAMKIHPHPRSEYGASSRPLPQETSEKPSPQRLSPLSRWRPPYRRRGHALRSSANQSELGWSCADFPSPRPSPQGEGGFLACRHQFSKDVLWERVGACPVLATGVRATPRNLPHLHRFGTVTHWSLQGGESGKASIPSPRPSPQGEGTIRAPLSEFTHRTGSPRMPRTSIRGTPRREDIRLLPAWDVRGSLAA